MSGHNVNTELKSASGKAPKMSWGDTNGVLAFLPDADDTGAVNVGDGSTDLDFKVFLGSTSAYMLADVGNARLQLADSVALALGTGADVRFAWDNANSIAEFLPAVDDTGVLAVGDGTTDMDFKAFLGDTTKYLLCDVGNQCVTLAFTGAGQSTENIGHNIAMTTDSTYLTGDDITYSSARGSSALKITSTFTGVGGGFCNIYSILTHNAAQTAGGAGAINAKFVTVNTAAMTDGNIYGAQFIAKHAHASNAMANEAALIGAEAIAYVSTTGKAGTCIGLNAVMRDYATAALSGSVHRGIQVVLDNPSIKATEVSGLCVWNMAGSADNVFNVVNSASGFTNLLKATDDGAPAQSTASTVSAIGTKGWIRVLIGSATRYIGLSETVS